MRRLQFLKTSLQSMTVPYDDGDDDDEDRQLN